MRLEEGCRGQLKEAAQKVEECKLHLRQEQLHLYKCHVRWARKLEYQGGRDRKKSEK
jgi:hypothetical protein